MDGQRCPKEMMKKEIERDLPLPNTHKCNECGLETRNWDSEGCALYCKCGKGMLLPITKKEDEGKSDQ